MTTKNNSLTGISPTSIQDIFTVNAAVDSEYVMTASNGSVNSKWAFTDSSGAINSSNGITMATDADITIGGKSMREFMEQVNERLAILEPNKKLEAEWAELKELGERYRAMERELLEKARVWKILND
tara:strand:- start:23499 stop:23879 length:381 start_codon:yes stop_codon:yes gene_type:complete